MEVRGSTTSETSDTRSTGDMLKPSERFISILQHHLAGRLGKIAISICSAHRSMFMDEKRNEMMGENPRKTSFRTLAQVARTMQPSPVEKQHSARFVNVCARHLRVRSFNFPKVAKLPQTYFSLLRSIFTGKHFPSGIRHCRGQVRGVPEFKQQEKWPLQIFF